MLLSGVLEQHYEIDPKEQLDAGCRRKRIFPIVVPGWEDSTMANIFALIASKGELKTKYYEKRHRIYD